jgi:hypothetical protein
LEKAADSEWEKGHYWKFYCNGRDTCSMAGKKTDMFLLSEEMAVGI